MQRQYVLLILIQVESEVLQLLKLKQKNKGNIKKSKAEEQKHITLLY